MARNMGADKDTEKMIRAARKQGWDVSLTKGNHVKFIPPNKSFGIIIGSLTGSVTSQRKLRHQLVRAGLAA